VFDGTGVRYPEEMLVGHEDWDLILQLAEREVSGLPADGPTFRYRKQGFSRANAVDYAPKAFYRVIEERHPRLYQDSDAIKANWSPALSIVLLDDDDCGWTSGDLSGLEKQKCRDFELLSRAESIEGAIAVTADSDSPLTWLQHAIHRASGRWILLLPRSAATVLDSPSVVGQLLHTFLANEDVLGTVLADLAGKPCRRLAQLNDVERLSASPAAVAFERLAWGRIQELPLSRGESPLADIVVGLQTQGPLQWRSAGASEPGLPWRRRSGEDAAEPASLDINLPAADGPDIAARKMMLHQAPRLPELATGARRRRKRSDPWMPPQSLLLFRHLNPATGMRIVIPGEEPPPGHVLERVLGSTRRFPMPGTKRLVQTGGRFATSAEQGDLGEGEYDLGFVERQRLPMLDTLELRRVFDSGQEMLVAGAGDPLVHNSELIESLGWIEACPIPPSAGDVLHTGPWAVVSLRRRVQDSNWSHNYRVDPPGEVGDAVELGSLCRHSGPGSVALRLRPDGRLTSELVTPGRASRDPRKIGRWLAEPLAADSQASSRMRGAASRLRHLARHSQSRRLSEEEGEILGYLPRQHMPGCSTLYSTIHPVTGDQLVTRVPHEATDAGYVMDGILGAIFDPPDSPTTPPEAMPWGRVSRG
jgi:hypothetical protein